MSSSLIQSPQAPRELRASDFMAACPVTRPEKTTDELPASLRVFLTDKGIAVASRPLVRVFCKCCDDLHEDERPEAARRSHDKRSFLCYRLGGFPDAILISPKSRGKDAHTYNIISSGGVTCEAQHYTGIHLGKVYTVSDMSRMNMRMSQSNIVDHLRQIELNRVSMATG